MGLAGARADGQFEITTEGAARHASEVARRPPQVLSSARR